MDLSSVWTFVDQFRLSPRSSKRVTLNICLVGEYCNNLEKYAAELSSKKTRISPEAELYRFNWTLSDQRRVSINLMVGQRPVPGFKADGVILMFDLSRLSTLRFISVLYNSFVHSDIPVVFVGHSPNQSKNDYGFYPLTYFNQKEKRVKDKHILALWEQTEYRHSFHQLSSKNSLEKPLLEIINSHLGEDDLSRVVH